MNRYQKQQDRSIRKLMRHLGIEKQETPDKEYRSAYRALSKMLKAMEKTEKWIKISERKGIYFGKMELDFSEPKVVRVVLHPEEGDTDQKTAVLSEIRGAM